MISFYKNLYVHSRTFLALSIVVVTFVLGFPFPIFFIIGKVLLVIVFTLMLLDAVLLFNKSTNLLVNRNLPNLMSLGGKNEIMISVFNNSPLGLSVSLLHEMPYQFQLRDNEISFELPKNKQKEIKQNLRPLSRGKYQFGHVRLFLRTSLSLIERKVDFEEETVVPVYPSIQDVKKYELMAIHQHSAQLGVKKMRRIGQSYEFEQISEYALGDDYNSLNWKATSRANRLMVNRFTDEKSQPVYVIIDKSRYMKMPFDGLTLLDYSINTALVIANTAIKKDDKIGLLTFSDKVETFLPADRKRGQIGKVLEALYREKETKIEANYELLYSNLRKRVNGRSLLFLFANFDTQSALERVLPVLRKMNKIHLLVLIVFENTELESYKSEEAEDALDIYNHTVADKLIQQKRTVLMLLKQYGIQVIYTKPQNLSISTINKYIELKSRGYI